MSSPRQCPLHSTLCRLPDAGVSTDGAGLRQAAVLVTMLASLQAQGQPVTSGASWDVCAPGPVVQTAGVRNTTARCKTHLLQHSRTNHTPQRRGTRSHPLPRGTKGPLGPSCHRLSTHPKARTSSPCYPRGPGAPSPHCTFKSFPTPPCTAADMCLGRGIAPCSHPACPAQQHCNPLEAAGRLVDTALISLAKSPGSTLSPLSHPSFLFCVSPWQAAGHSPSMWCQPPMWDKWTEPLAPSCLAQA